MPNTGRRTRVNRREREIQGDYRLTQEGRVKWVLRDKNKSNNREKEWD